MFCNFHTRYQTPISLSLIISLYKDVLRNGHRYAAIARCQIQFLDLSTII